jgi:serine/threonine protein kinase
MGGGASKSKDASPRASRPTLGGKQPTGNVQALEITPLPPLGELATLPTSTLADFELAATLGIGSFGRVHFCTHNTTGTHWAMKQLKKQAVIDNSQCDHMKREKNILASLHHPFVVGLATTFQDTKCLYMVIEYIAGGAFDTYLTGEGFLNEDRTRFYLAQLVLIFEYMHGETTGKVIYRDLKPSNLILGIDGYLKLTDFGFAKVVGDGLTHTFLGTPS